MTQASQKKHKDRHCLIRLAHKRDMPEIVDIQLKSLEILAAKDYQPEQLQVLLASKRGRRSIFETIFVAEIESIIVGFIALDRFTNSISGLFISPQYVRQGIGTKLINKVEQEAIRYKIPILWVCASLTGYPFYLANNYQKIDRTSIQVKGVLIPCIQMKKILSTQTKSAQIQEILYQFFLYSTIIWSLIILITQF